MHTLPATTISRPEAAALDPLLAVVREDPFDPRPPQLVEVRQGETLAALVDRLGLDPIARDLADHGIRCVAIAPGVFETELTASVPEKGREAMERNFLFPRRTGHPSEFADMVLTLISNPYLNGDCFRIDGGTRFAP